MGTAPVTLLMFSLQIGFYRFIGMNEAELFAYSQWTRT
jgi:hypothetical protein